MNDQLTATDFFTNKKKQIEESIKTGKITFDKLQKELELITSKPELTGVGRCGVSMGFLREKINLSFTIRLSL